MKMIQLPILKLIKTEIIYKHYILEWNKNKNLIKNFFITIKRMILSRNIKIIIGWYIIHILLRYAWIWNDYIKIFHTWKSKKKKKTNNKKIII